jgi:isopenicillin N synthase-like dioxygenase
MTQLPVFDVRALDAGEKIAELRQACQGTGFFYIADHGIDPALIDAAAEQMRLFFAQPLEQRLAVALSKSTCNRGYEPMLAQILEPGMPPDLKEGFYVGNDHGPDHPYVRAGYFNQGPNQWPLDLPTFKPAMEAYFAAMESLATRLMRAMALSLNLPADHFAAFCDQPVSILRLLHYPPQPGNPKPGEKGCGAHTDWGCLTLLWQDQNGGLQVQVDNEWIEAPPLPGTFVVNIGDMFARWTNDLYRSTLHRVINRSGTERYSMPFFFEGSPGHPVEVLPVCVANGAAPLYPPTTVSDHLQGMYRKTYIAAE